MSIGLTRRLAHMPEKQARTPIATKTAAIKTTFIERRIETLIFRLICERVDGDRHSMIELVLELYGAADEAIFFRRVCSIGELTLTPHQRLFGSFISTKHDGLGLASWVDRRLAAAAGSVYKVLPAVLTG